MDEAFKLFEFLHILSAAVLFGTGLGIGFFMVMAARSGNALVIASTARIAVIADFALTVPCLVLQLLTGVGMVQAAGISMGEEWISGALIIFAFVIVLRLLALRMQVQIGKTAGAAIDVGAAFLPERYRDLMRIWFWSEMPALLGLVAIFFIMVAKPELW